MEKLINMMQHSFTELKNIKFSYLILILLLACSTPKKIEEQHDKQLILCLNDFISEYKVLKPDKDLSALMIKSKIENNNIIYVLCDAPEKVIYGGLSDLKKNKTNSFSIGVYNGLLCQFYTKNLNNYSSVFKDVDIAVKEKASSFEIVTDNDGKTYTLDLSLLNWEPEIEIIYNINKSKKEIHFTKNHKTQIKKFN